MKAIFIFCVLLGFNSLFAQIGKNGARVVNGLGNIVNEYTSLTANAVAGSTTLTVASSTLNANGRFSAPLSAGDLIMIIQMQGAVMNNTNTVNYGNVTNYANCGRYELAQVASVPSPTTIRVDCGLQNAYTANGRVQIVRIPRFTTLTVNAGAELTCDPWNGTFGGVLATETAGNTTIQAGGTVDATGKGFRGGIVEDDASGFSITAQRSSVSTDGAEKGESIAGSQADYDATYNGRWGRGAPANGGGGGNGHNSGGGGGANSGNILNWNGNGNPNNSVPGWTTAWNLESPGFSGNISSGGGRGGYAYSSANADATIDGPGSIAWGGDNRAIVGGLGGRPLDYSTGRFFLGGGGGAGDENNAAGGNGGNGGGIIYMFSWTAINGTGTIRSNGAPGGPSTGGGNDGPGGGGGGGVIALNALSPINTPILQANGGAGGNQVIANAEAEGPGGGGGAGFIALSSGSPTMGAFGGPNGTTNSPSLTEFLPNGATSGGDGLLNGQVNNYAVIPTPDTVCSGDQASLSAVYIGAPATLVWSTAPAGGTLLGTGPSITTPPVFANTTFWVGPCPGFSRFPVTVVVRPEPAANISGPIAVCENNQVAIAYSSPNHPGNIYVWAVTGGTISSGAGTNAINVLWGNAGAGTVQLTETDPFACDTTITRAITINPRPNPVITGLTTVCRNMIGVNYSVANVAGHTYAWTVTGGTIASGAGTNAITVNWGAGSTGTVQLVQTTAQGCDTTVTANISIVPRPNPIISGATSVCQFASNQVYSVPSVGGNTYAWTTTGGTVVGSSSGTTFTINWDVPGTYTISLTQTGIPGCDTTVSINITVNPKPSPTISGPTTVCANTTGQAYSTPNVAGNTYVWTVIGGTLVSGQGTNAISVDWSTPGTRTVRVQETNPQGCDTTVNLTVIVNPAPNPNITGPLTACETSTGNVYSVANNPGNTYIWIVSIGNISSGQGTNSVTVDFGAPGTGTLQVIESNAFGCFVTQTINITVTPRPFPAISGPAVACENQASVYTGSPAGSIGLWAWSATNGSVQSGNGTPSVSILFGAPGPATVSLLATNAFGCSQTVSIPVTVQAAPSPTISGPNQPCEFTTAVYTTPSSGGGSWTWTANGGTIISGQGTNTVTISWGVFGNRSVSVTETNGFNCSGNNSFTVTVRPRPTGTIRGQDSVCRNANGLTYRAPNGSDITSWVWAVAGGTLVSGQGTSTVAVDWGNGGGGQLSCTVTNAFGCDTTFLLPVVFLPSVNLSFQPLDTTGCAPLFLTFDGTASTGGTSYAWQYGDGGFLSGISTTHTYTVPGTYTVNFIGDNGGGCRDTLQGTVTVLPSPTAQFDFRFEPIRIPFDTAFINNLSFGGSTYYWDFGDGGSSTAFEPTHLYEAPGIFPILLVVQNSDGCQDVFRDFITVEAPFTLHIPTGFSPNGDGNNDEFFVVSENLIQFHLSLYDRWGKLIYDTNDINFRWDGRFNGNDLPECVLVYVVEGTARDLKPVKASGSLTIIR